MASRVVIAAACVLFTASARAGGFGDLEVIGAIEALEAGDDARAFELASGWLRGPWQGERRAEARLIAARAALNLGESPRALELLDGIDEELPEVADLVLGFRARALRMQHQWEPAAGLWRDILRRFPSSPFAPEARYGIGDALFAAERHRDAEAAYESALRASRRSDHEPVARLNLARIAEREQRWVVAAAGYGYLAHYRPGDPAGELAAERLASLIARGHAKPPTLLQQLARVDVLLTSRSLEEAEAALAAAAAQVDAAGREAYDYRVAKLAYRRGDFDAAVELFTRLAKRARPRERLDYEQWLARTHSTAGRYAESIAVYLRIAERESKRRDGREALFKAGWLAYHGADHRRALELFARFMDRYPGDRAADEALWYMAWNAYRLGDLPLAVATLERLRDEHPDSSLVQRTLYWQGRFTALLADLGAAREAYAQAVALEPLSYYGVLAAQKLRLLESDVAPVVFLDGTSALATLGGTPPPAGSPEPGRAELPLLGDSTFAREVETPPWGAAVLDWSSDEGRRAVRMIRLGLRDLAADTVASVPAHEGFDASDVLYARARLLYGLGDYNAAYRLVEIGFGQAMRGGPGATARRYFRLAYPDAHPAVVTAAAREFDLSPLLILSIMRQESGFDERARSGASAHGLMQIIPPTASRIAAELEVELHDRQLRQPAVNVRFGAWYLAQLLDKFGGNPVLAAASYNAGPAAVESWVDMHAGRPLDEFVEDIPFRETRHYVKRIVGNLAVYAWLYGGKAVSLAEQVPASYLDNVDF